MADFSTEVLAEIDRFKVTRQEAVLRVAKRRPDLHKAYLLATNDPDASGEIAARFKRRDNKGKK